MTTTPHEPFEQPSSDDRGRLYDADGNVVRSQVQYRWRTLSPAAQAYGRIWDVSRADTDTDLIELFRADRAIVEEAGDEFFAAFPEFETNPPPHGEATP